MRRILVFTVILALLAASGSAMNKGELIDNIASEAAVGHGEDVKTVTLTWATGEGDAGSYETTVSTATGHGDRVREAVKWYYEEEDEDIFVHVSGLIDDIQEDDRVTFEVEEGDRGPIAVDVELAEEEEETREGRNPQTGRELQIEDPGDVEYSEVVGEAIEYLEENAKK